MVSEAEQRTRTLRFSLARSVFVACRNWDCTLTSPSNTFPAITANEQPGTEIIRASAKGRGKGRFFARRFAGKRRRKTEIVHIGGFPSNQVLPVMFEVGREEI